MSNEDTKKDSDKSGQTSGQGGTQPKETGQGGHQNPGDTAPKKEEPGSRGFDDGVGRW
jgi:hypothetical protein